MFLKLQSKFILSLALKLLLFFILPIHCVVALSNEGLPGSYGQSDIENAEQPDATDRSQQLYPIPPIDSGTIKKETPNKTKGSSTGPNGNSRDDAENQIENSLNQNPVMADEIITETIRTKVANDPHVSSSILIVLTQHGVVTLTGVVQTISEKEAVEAIAQDTAGVREVHSRITIEPQGGFASPEYSPGLQQPPLVPPTP